MRKLYIFLLMMIPLSIFCQENDEVIRKNKNGNWELDQTTVEASYYATIERDSLLKEVLRLRGRVKDLEVNNVKLIDRIISLTDNLQDQLITVKEKSEEVNKTNNKLIKTWKKLYTSFDIRAVTQIQGDGNFYVGASLFIPIDLNFSLNTQYLFNLSSKENNYVIGLNYKL